MLDFGAVNLMKIIVFSNKIENKIRKNTRKKKKRLIKTIIIYDYDTL